MRWLWWFTIVVIVPGCGPADDERAEVATTATVPLARIRLPDAAGDAESPLVDALAERRSIRAYSAEPLTMEELSRLLWATQGVTSEVGQRTAPSAGGLYPLEVYVVAPTGTYRYEPADHSLLVMSDADLRSALAGAALDQTAVGDGAAVFVITAVYERTAQKYGERAARYVQLEAGHAAQNLLLMATALELAAVPIGAFVDADVQSVLGLPADHEPLYLVPVGHRRDLP